MKPSVFVGSSSEQVRIAEAVEVNLTSMADVSSWPHCFRAGQPIYTELLKIIYSVDFAILVLTPDDVIISREQPEFGPRDNVVFELGLFLGSIGAERVFAVVDEHTKTKIMSDYHGVMILTYDSKRIDGDLIKALSPACIKIKNYMRGLTNRKLEVNIITRPVKSLINTPLNDREVHNGLDYLCSEALIVDPCFLIGINRGGAIMGGMIAKRLGMMIQILEVTHYRNPVYLNIADDLLDGKKVLLIDDRLRSGNNMAQARAYLQKRRATVWSMVFTIPEGWANQGLLQEFAYKVSVPDLPFPWEPGGAREWGK